MNRPLRDTNRDITNSQVEIPSCIGGWNTRDAMSMMPITDAVVMDNFMALEGYVELRRGYTNVASLNNANVIKDLGEIGTLMSYDVDNVKNNTQHKQTDSIIFVATKPLEASAKVYKYTPNTPDVAPVPIKPSTINIPKNKYNHLLYRKTLIMTKAGNTPLWFIENDTGTAQANEMKINVTGVPSDIELIHNTMIDQVALYRDRLFFSIKDELVLLCTKKAGIVPVTSTSENPYNIELGCIDLSMFCSKGGSIALIANWTKTGAESLGNFLVVITTKGEVLVFSGNDPIPYSPTPVAPDKEKWNLEGRFEIPKVIQGSNAVRVGGDLVIMTTEGYMGIGDLLNANFINTDNAISNKIGAAVKEVLQYKDFPHWNLTFSINNNLLIANVPAVKDGGRFTSHQHVLNLSTNAWCRFKGLNATCFATFRDKLYFAKIDGGLYEMFNGSSDDGNNIEGYVQQAYSNFQSPKTKIFREVDIVASDTLGINFKVNFNVDFKASYNRADVSTVTDSAIWNKSSWDESVWNSGGVSRIVSSVINAPPGVFGSMGLTVYAHYSYIR